MTANPRFIHRVRPALFAALASLSGVAMAGAYDQPVKVNVEGLQRNVAEKVQKHADESLDSLMAYLWFTRRHHGLWIDDVTGPSRDAVATTEKKEYRTIATRTTGAR
jgi:hypothetical protein